jgi:chemotaxis protein CheX
MQKVSVLIAAQNTERRTTIRELIQSLGDAAFHVVEAADGVDLCSRAARQRFELVILDQFLEKSDGVLALHTMSKLVKEMRPLFVLLLAGKNQPSLPEFGFPLECSSAEDHSGVIEAWCKKHALTLQKGKPPASNFDTKLVNAFIDSTLKVLETTAQVSSKKEKIFIRDKTSPSGDISAVIPIQSKKQSGSMAISFESKCYLGIVSRMLGEEYKILTPEIADAAAELCSQIFGQAKVTLNGNGYEIKSAIPFIIHEENHCVTHRTDGPCVAVRFSTELGHFIIEANLADTA